MRPRPGVGALGVAADQVRGDRKPLEICGFEGATSQAAAVSCWLRISPGLPLERGSALIGRGGRGHGTRHRKMWLRIPLTESVSVRSGTQSPMPYRWDTIRLPGLSWLVNFSRSRAFSSGERKSVTTVAG